MADSIDSVRERLNRLRRDFGHSHEDKETKENVTGSLTMDPTTWINRISDAGHKPEDWLDYLDYLEHRSNFADVTNKYRTMWSAYNRAMKNIKLDVHRFNKAYAQIVVRFAWLKETESVDDARLLFKFARGNLKPFAFIHVAAAQLEKRYGDMEKCVNILKKAKSIDAQPKEMLDMALQRCYAGETSLIPPTEDSHGSTLKSKMSTKPTTKMEVDEQQLCSQEKADTGVQRMEVDAQPQILEQSRVDSTISFNLPEKRHRNPSSASNSDEADTIPWLSNKFHMYNQQQISAKTQQPIPSNSSHGNPRQAHTVCKNVRSSSLVTPNCKPQSMTSASVGGASRRRPGAKLGAATRIRLTSHVQQQHQPQQTSQDKDDSDDDDDSYFVDFKPLDKISPPTQTKPLNMVPLAVIDEKEPPPSQPIIADTKTPQPTLSTIADTKPVRPPLSVITENMGNSGDSGVGLTPVEDKPPHDYLNNPKPTDQAVRALTMSTSQDTSPFSVHQNLSKPQDCNNPMVQSQPKFVTASVTPPQANAVNGAPAAPVPSVNPKQAEPVKDDIPFVPPRMPKSKPKNTIKVNDKLYTIHRTIGKGGSSKVFETFGEDKEIVAIKSVNLEYADDMTIKGYLNEITLLHKLRKSNHIIRLYDYEVTDNHLAIVMEKGSVDLSTFLKKNKNINIEKIKFYWMEMLEAVEVVHKEGIIHSDLKPANFLFVDGKLKLIDFGIANSIQADKTSVIRESQVGTLNYMSPEAIQDTSPTPQTDARGHRRPRLKINCKSDVWSLGCILYYMVYGRTPFQHITNTLAKLQAICDPSHQIKFPDIENKFLLDTIKKCLIRDVSRRPSIKELLEHPYLNSNAQPETAKVATPERHVQSLFAQLTQLNSPNTLKNVFAKMVMEQQMAKSQGQCDPSPLVQSAAPQQMNHSTTPYSTNGMHPQQSHQQHAPPASSGMIPTSYNSNSSAFHNPMSIGEPVRPIARAPLQALNVDDLQRAPVQSNSNMFMTQEKENKDMESVLRSQLAQKYQPAHSSQSVVNEQTWTPQTMK